MKKLLYAGLALLVLAFLAMPGWAQRGARGRGAGKAPDAAPASEDQGPANAATSHPSKPSKRSRRDARSNKHGATHGIERAEQVQGMNTKADTNRGFTTPAGLERAETKAASPAGGTGTTKPSSKSRRSSHRKKGKRG